ncbi:DNA mismatch endonuclease Vsr [Burkholderia cenocepacia]|uniref:very short patch repair endonuclease n=1 Tax=Burkholderia cenocepacia TaxID=95486 RepID=UPI002B245BD5|nr:DNA mismatch endonuclease Vsr [Burkholderia cenocepacia]MEB2604777.1 DNA mismatch endonuclease Vsr [Burkholderia cenocepacia]
MSIGRSENMRRIRSRDTAPEMIVRRIVYAMGYRYRLHRKDIPGKPDLAFPGRRKVIFVHGCFWHQHSGCRDGRAPKSNTGYWLPKLMRNKERDKIVIDQLTSLGWSVLTVWECETKNVSHLENIIDDFLGK